MFGDCKLSRQTWETIAVLTFDFVVVFAALFCGVTAVAMLLP